METSKQEAQWVLRAQCDDREAMELLLGSVQGSLSRYLSGLVGSGDADDILQNVLVLIYRKLAWLEDPTLFRPWAFRIASRAAFRWLKRQKRWQEEEAGEIALEGIPMQDQPSDELLREPPGHRGRFAGKPGCSGLALSGRPPAVRGRCNS